MYVGRINKEMGDVSRATVDVTPWLDQGEIITSILVHNISLGTTGWSDTPYPPPGSGLPYDPTPLLFAYVKIVNSGTAVEMMVGNGTPGNAYTCQFEVLGTSNREVNFEVGVQVTGVPPQNPPVVTRPLPLDALSIYGGTMQGPLYLYEDPVYPTEAATKQYVDFQVALLGYNDKVSRSGDAMTGMLSLFADPVTPLQAATKQYVDMASGSGLSDAPNDGHYYGRRNLAWAQVINEAPADGFGYVRLNTVWVHGIPQNNVTTDVRVTDAGGGIPLLSAWQTPANASVDVFDLSARRLSTGAFGDGAMIQLTGPTFPTTPNAIFFQAGPRATRMTMELLQDGTLVAPGYLDAAGPIRGKSGRIVSMAYTAGFQPSVVGYDYGSGVASGFWVQPTGTISFGPTDGSGLPLAVWAHIDGSGFVIGSGGFTTPSINCTGTVTGVDLHATHDVIADHDVHAANISFAESFYGNNGVIVVDFNVGRNASVTGTLTVGGNAAFGQALSVAAGITAVNGNMQIRDTGTECIFQFNPSWYWSWNKSSNDVNLQRPGGTALRLRAADGYTISPIGPVSGNGPYFDASDERGKTDIVHATYGLPEILRIEPIMFNRKVHEGFPARSREIGFSAQQLARILPETVTTVAIELPDGTGGIDDPNPSLGISTTGIMAAMVNAIKTLEARVAQLEGAR